MYVFLSVYMSLVIIGLFLYSLLCSSFLYVCISLFLYFVRYFCV